LSQSNGKLGKRTLQEYLEEQEQLKNATFKARKLNKQILVGRCVSQSSRQSAEPRLKFVPFEFQTEKRLQKERRSLSAISTQSEPA